MVHVQQQETVIAQAKQVITTEIEALQAMEVRLDHHFETAIAILEACQGRVIITGMGKSGIVGKKMAATFSSTGTPAYFLHPGEGVHGDLGMLMRGDVIIAISNSGETPELLQVLPVVKRFELPMIALTGNQESTLARRSQAVLDISVAQEAGCLNLAPTSSTTTTMVMGDALAVVLSERKGFTSEDFAVFHPAGSLGKRLLLTVADVMHAGENVPIVSLEDTFGDAMIEMTTKKLGMTVVIDASGKTCGVVTDGDVRRAFSKGGDMQQLAVKDVYTENPKSIQQESLAAVALTIMEQHKITALVVDDGDGKPEGVVHLHDLLRTGL